jgi:hypothetical protein
MNDTTVQANSVYYDRESQHNDVFKVLKFESPEESDVTSTLKEVNKTLWLLLILVRWDVSAHVVYM